MFSQIIILSLICVNPISLHREEDIALHPDLKVRHRREEPTKTTDPELNQDLICKGEHTHFKVTAGFKLDDFIGVVGKLWKEPDSEDKATDVAVKVTVWQQPDPSQQTAYKYFDAVVWPDINKINKEKKIKYAFSADFITDLFSTNPDVISTFSARREKVFIVQDTNTTTAFNFAKEQKQGPNDSSIYNIIDKMVVYDPAQDFDLSAYLSIKLLYLHFPQELRIIGIVVFNLFKGYHRDANHYAIVYTEEVFEGKSYYFRHYMRTEKHGFTDYRGEGSTVYRLDWYFDQNVDYCDAMEKGPDSVVMMFSKRRYFTHTKTREDLIQWAEFYGTTHTTMQLTLQHYEEKYTIKEYEKDIDNAKSLLHCESHPATLEKTPIPCDDYIIRDIDRDEWIKKSDSGISSSTLYIIAIILTIIGIIFLLVIGGLLLSSRNK